MPICQNLDGDMITSYIGEYLNRVFTKPSISEFYPEQDDVMDEEQKGEDSIVQEIKMQSQNQHYLSI